MSKHNIDLEVAGLHIAALQRQEAFMPWGFTMTHDANNEESDCRVLFDATLHEPAGVRRFLNRYRRLLAVCALGDPDQTMTGLLARSVPETPLQRAINWVRGNS
jgi:hypothetical protein